MNDMYSAFVLIYVFTSEFIGPEVEVAYLEHIKVLHLWHL